MVLSTVGQWSQKHTVWAEEVIQFGDAWPRLEELNCRAPWLHWTDHIPRPLHGPVETSVSRATTAPAWKPTLRVSLRILFQPEVEWRRWSQTSSSRTRYGRFLKTTKQFWNNVHKGMIFRYSSIQNFVHIDLQYMEVLALCKADIFCVHVGLNLLYFIDFALVA